MENERWYEQVRPQILAVIIVIAVFGILSMCLNREGINSKDVLLTVGPILGMIVQRLLDGKDQLQETLKVLAEKLAKIEELLAARIPPS